MLVLATKDPEELLQETLDNALASQGIYTYWQNKTETEGENKEEYLVYTNDDGVEISADNQPWLEIFNYTLRYYYDQNLTETIQGRNKVRKRIKDISKALKKSGFAEKHFDSGDIDGIGFGTTIFEVRIGAISQ